MKTFNFPIIALGLGSFLMLVVLIGSRGETTLPMLSLLFINEFAFIVTAIGAFNGVKNIKTLGLKPGKLVVTVFCALLSAGFMVLGIELWPL